LLTQIDTGVPRAFWKERCFATRAHSHSNDVNDQQHLRRLRQQATSL